MNKNRPGANVPITVRLSDADALKLIRLAKFSNIGKSTLARNIIRNALNE